MATRFPCPEVINKCLPCNDEPIANFSAEAPDDPLFCATVTFTEEPSIGMCADEISDTEICCSTVNYQDAYLCALQLAQETVWETWKEAPCPIPECPPECEIDCPTECPPGCPPFCPPPSNPNPKTPPNTPTFLNDAQSCTVNCPGGGTFTYTVAAGKVTSLFSQQQANFLAFSLACRLARQLALCLSVQGPTSGCKGQPMSFKVIASGPASQSPLPTSWTITGPALDPNVVTYDLSAISGTTEMTIFGTPTIAIQTYIIARFNDNNTGFFGQLQIPITIAEITTTSPLPNGTINAAYSQSLATSQMTSPITWSVTSGSLPPGLTLNPSTGVISGTPTVIGTFNFTVRAVDSTP